MHVFEAAGGFLVKKYSTPILLSLLWKLKKSTWPNIIISMSIN